VDDLVAVLIIALVFTDVLAWGWPGLAAGAFGIVYVFHHIGVRSIGVYVLVGAFIWLAFLQSGVHPTVAGVLLGLLTPAHAWIGQKTFADVLKAAWRRVSREGRDPSAARADAGRTQLAAREAVSPLQRLEDGLHPWVAFVIMPVFALANAGVS
jgi:Na+:H+ antiporter, NhaA family